MMPIVIGKQRKSFIESGKIYFWTASIHNWFHLLAEEKFKRVIIDSWENLSHRNKIDVFGFVIMPNHIHTIWQINELNGKESPQASFLKFTAHEFRKMLGHDSTNILPFRVFDPYRDHQFWQRDPLGIPIFSREVAHHKLEYIHNNPIAHKWKLAKMPVTYKYSSAGFYKTGRSEFSFLKNLWLRI